MEIRQNAFDFKLLNEEQKNEITEEQKQDSFNPFDVYSQMYYELNDGKSSSLDIQTFNQIMSGEIETDDILALNVIQAAQLDKDTTTVSEDELNELYNFYFGEINPTQDLIQEQINAQFEDLAQYYLGKSASECTPEELNQAYALSIIENITLSSQMGLDSQDAKDGWISKWFDIFKATNGIDLTQNTVQDAINKEQKILNTLKDTLLNDGDFKTTYKELTGVEFDAEKIISYQEKTSQLQFISKGFEKIDSFCVKKKNKQKIFVFF